MLRTRSPFKLKLEIRVSVLISWENLNANRVFSINLNIFNNFHFQKIEGGRNPQIAPLDPPLAFKVFKLSKYIAFSKDKLITLDDAF